MCPWFHFSYCWISSLLRYFKNCFRPSTLPRNPFRFPLRFHTWIKLLRTSFFPYSYELFHLPAPVYCFSAHSENLQQMPPLLNIPAGLWPFYSYYQDSRRQKPPEETFWSYYSEAYSKCTEKVIWLHRKLDGLNPENLLWVPLLPYTCCESTILGLQLRVPQRATAHPGDALRMPSGKTLKATSERHCKSSRKDFMGATEICPRHTLVASIPQKTLRNPRVSKMLANCTKVTCGSNI